MNTHHLALQLMALQGILGAFDTLYHHELTEALPGRRTARRELFIHALRALIYGALFIGLSSWVFHGVWAVALMAVLAVEMGLTLWDFVIEDQTRLLPASERITHTLLAVNGGAFITLLALNVPAWLAMPSALVWQPQGALGIFLALCGVGVALSGVRDGFAARALGREDTLAVRFSDTEKAVLVTGATGFIGQKLVAALLGDGHRVTVLTRDPRKAAWLFDGRVECVASMDALPLTRRFDIVFNLAGARILGWRWTPLRRAVLRRSRIDFTRRLVTWIGKAQHKPALMLSASAIGYYGIQERGDDTVLDEDKGPQQMFMSDLCREWEAAAGGAWVFGVRVANLRFGLVLGGQGALPMMLLPIKLGLGGPLGGGRQWLSWIHVDDVIGVMAHVCRTGEGGPYNVTAPESVTQGQFARVAAQVHGRPALFPTPGYPIRLALGEQADLLLEGQRVAPLRLLKEGFNFAHPQLAGALASLAGRSDPNA